MPSREAVPVGVEVSEETGPEHEAEKSAKGLSEKAPECRFTDAAPLSEAERMEGKLQAGGTALPGRAFKPEEKA
jgi:hypothetical protein